MALQQDPRRPQRQDTFDLRDQIHADDSHNHHDLQAHADAAAAAHAHHHHHHHGGQQIYTSDEEHSVLEDDSDNEIDPTVEEEEYEDDDGSSSLSIPNESIDFDLVYSLHSFAATVEGQANVVKGDSLFLMDDSNSYWWLVRVLKTQEVGYIPAENIETPFERLARLNKHRNVDLASATQAELQDGLIASQDRLRNNLSSRSGNTPSPNPQSSRSRQQPQPRGVHFTPALSVHRYPPAVWKEEDEDDEDEETEWDDEGYEDEDPGLAAEQMERRREEEIVMNGGVVGAAGATGAGAGMNMSMEPDDGMLWDDAAAEELQMQRHLQAQAQANAQAQAGGAGIPDALQPSLARDKQQQQQQQQQMLKAQQQKQMEIQQQQQQQQQAQQAQLYQNQRQAANQISQQASLQQQLVQGQQQQQQQGQSLRGSSSRERLIDPLLDVGNAETRRVTVTPSIARESEVPNAAAVTQVSSSTGANNNKPFLPSAIVDRQKEEERMKRAREEEVAAGEEAKKKARGAGVVSPSLSVGAKQPQVQQGNKLRKEPSRESDDSQASGGEKKKKGGVFGGLFGRKNKDKDRDGGKDGGKGRERSVSNGSLESGEAGRVSEESSRLGHGGKSGDGVMSPTTVVALQQQQMQTAAATRTTPDIKQQQQQQSLTSSSSPPQSNPVTPERPAQVSAHASQLRQRDQQQQALYQQYLNRSPSSPPEAQPSYGLQSASAVMPGVSVSMASPVGPNASFSPGERSSGSGLGPPSAPRQRPGSLILTSSSSMMDGQGGPGVPDLSVIRVFAGRNLQTEATFKTVLLNASTTSADLVRQALQRFRLGTTGLDDQSQNGAAQYYLTVKQVEGGASAMLMPHEKPLVVFETLVSEAMELPKVKRSSISSITSNLSMHPAITKLSMNDFTDDSAVKFYLNRRGGEGEEGGEEGDGVGNGNEGDDTLIADTSHDGSELGSPLRGQYLTVGGGAQNVTPERFTSPSFRFALQLVIYPDDLPEDMVFHPLTEAIVFKDTLLPRDASQKPSVSPNMRRKVFMFPKNVTVAEVIELGLERFGILEGVVDGGDEVEDKLVKRRSMMRVRYWLCVNTGNGEERELSPSSRVIDAYPRPPTYRAPERVNSASKRRSVDSAQLLGTMDDVNADDPIFILRRATSYRNSTSRHRMSAPLDEIALQHLHLQRESSASSSVGGGSEPNTPNALNGEFKQPSRQEIIAAQRAATRANQRAILSAQTNSLRGMDVLLPGNAMLRSSRYDANAKMRYSYVEPDGETYDISDIVEEEWRENGPPTNRKDLLEGVLVRGGKDRDIGEKLDRVLSKIRNEKSSRAGAGSVDSHQSQMTLIRASERSPSPKSVYSVDDTVGGDQHSRSGTPGSAGLSSRMTNGAGGLARSGSVGGGASRPGTNTPTQAVGKTVPAGLARRHPSIASVISDGSGYSTPPSNLSTLSETPETTPQKSQSQPTPTNPPPKRLVLPKNDFGISEMMAVIEMRALQPHSAELPEGQNSSYHNGYGGAVEMDPVDRMLFGPSLDLEALHPNVRDIYSDGFKQLQDMDKVLDTFLQHSLSAF